VINHEINYWQPPFTQNKRESKPKYKPGSPEHREFILARSVKAIKGDAKYALNSLWYVPKYKEMGTLINIIETIEDVEWEGLKVLFLELYFPSDNLFILLHPLLISKMHSVFMYFCYIHKYGGLILFLKPPVCALIALGKVTIGVRPEFFTHYTTCKELLITIVD